MTEKVYFDLREQLDQYSLGFPSTESGVELQILEKLFSEDEAEMYLNLSMMLETPEAVAQRIGREPDEVGKLLERMVDKGLIFRMNKGDIAKYGAAPFVVGFFEFQLGDMDREFAELFERYLQEAFGRGGITEMSPMRTIPVNQSIDYQWPIAPYEDVKEIIRSKEKIAVAKCICRVQQQLLDKSCDQPLEVCFLFGSHAQYYVDKGMGRLVEQEEALRIIDDCNDYGLVSQPFMAQDAGGLCNCCGDCCASLRSIKMHPKPAEKVFTNYFAEVDLETCSACEICVDRCQMEAIGMGAGEVAEIDRDRCIGCGLCVTTCPEEALTLQPKPESERREPPATGREYFMQLAQSRGKSLIPLAVSKQSQRSS
jgi:ferredoxin